MLKKLTVNNFQKHESFIAEFQPGTTILTGDNWAGKSTLFRAITYALYGPRQLEINAKTLQRWGTKAKPQVELVFTAKVPAALSGTGEEVGEFRVVRSPTKAILYLDQMEVASGQDAVTQEIEGLLGLDAKTFVALRASPQEEAAAVLTLGAEQLSGIIDRITQVDLVNRVLALATAEGKALEIELGVTQTEDLDALVARGTDEYVILIASFTVLGEKRIEATEQAARAAAAQEAVQAARGRLLAANQARFLRQRLEVALAQAQAASAAVLANAPAPGTSPSAAEVEARQQAAAQAAAALEQARMVAGRWHDYRARVTWVQDRRREYQAQCEEHLRRRPGSPAPTREDLDEAAMRVGDAVAALSDIARRHSQLSVALKAAVCPTCRRPFEDHNPAELEAELGALKAAHQQAADEAMSAQQEQRDRQELTRAWEAWEARQQALEARPEEEEPVPPPGAEPGAAELQALQEAALQLRDTWQASVSAFQRAKDSLEAVSQAAILEARRQMELEEHVIPEAETEEQMAELEALAAQAASAASEARAQAAAAETDYAHRYHRYTELQARVQAAQAQAEQLAVKRLRADRISKLIAYLRKNRDTFSARVWESILGYASEFASAASGGAVEAVLRGTDGRFRFRQAGNEEGVSAASGYLKAIIATGVRLALAEALRSPADFVLLDEVTAGARSERSMALTQALATTGAQVLMITHRAEDAAIADHLIEVA